MSELSEYQPPRSKSIDNDGRSSPISSSRSASPVEAADEIYDDDQLLNEKEVVFKKVIATGILRNTKAGKGSSLAEGRITIHNHLTHKAVLIRVRRVLGEADDAGIASLFIKIGQDRFTAIDVEERWQATALRLARTTKAPMIQMKVEFREVIRKKSASSKAQAGKHKAQVEIASSSETDALPAKRRRNGTKATELDQLISPIVDKICLTHPEKPCTINPGVTHRCVEVQGQHVVLDDSKLKSWAILVNSDKANTKHPPAALRAQAEPRRAGDAPMNLPFAGPNTQPFYPPPPFGYPPAYGAPYTPMPGTPAMFQHHQPYFPGQPYAQGRPQPAVIPAPKNDQDPAPSSDPYDGTLDSFAFDCRVDEGVKEKLRAQGYDPIVKVATLEHGYFQNPSFGENALTDPEERGFRARVANYKRKRTS